jgi:hypothetical protein
MEALLAGDDAVRCYYSKLVHGAFCHGVLFVVADPLLRTHVAMDPARAML